MIHQSPSHTHDIHSSDDTQTHHILSLTQYLNAVKNAIGQHFACDVWIACEIRAMNSKGGHYYFELADKDDNSISASCRGTLWRYHAIKIIRRFESITNIKLTAGLKVLLRGRASFHAQFGFSFNITDIDPSFTLGELMQAYQMMKLKLENNGLLTLNRSIDTPFDIQNVAVIAPENAAGLGDFQAEAERLARCGVCQFHYYHATFQGNDATKSIQQIIGNIHMDLHHLPFDLLVIIRGGGAVGDLAYLNDYELAATLAEMPIPVWVGIGHEKDKVILDEVAHRSFDTPSKVIHAIEAHIVRLWQSAMALKNNISYRIFLQLDKEGNHLNTLLNQVRMNSYHIQNHHRHHINNHLTIIRQASFYQIHQARIHTKQALTRHQIYQLKLQNWRKHIKQLQNHILSHHPQNSLKQGYAIIRNSSGQILTSQNQAKEQTFVSIEFHDGLVKAMIAPSS